MARSLKSLVGEFHPARAAVFRRPTIPFLLPEGFTRLQFRVLGIIGYDADGGSATEVRGNGRVLLAALALTPDRPVAGDILIDAIWGEAGAPRATLHVEVSRLRTWLRSHGGDPDSIVTSAAGYRLVASPDEVDASRMAALVRRGERSLRQGDSRTAVRLLTEALGLWGEPFPGLGFRPPFDAAAGELRELAARADEVLSEAQLEIGAVDIGRLQRLVGEEPVREVRWRHLMLALYRDGRQADALRVFRRASERLAEVGLVPSRSLADLEEGILAGDPGLDALSRLQVPSESSSFVGRVAAVQALVGLVERRRIVCLTGPGGVGKSRLALRVAHQLAPRFHDGAAFISLAHVSDPATVAPSVATALGVAQRPGVSATDAISNAVRGRSLLIVLDNCEHVGDAAAEIVRVLAAASDTVTVLATSQHDLRIPGSAVWPLEPFPLPASEWDSGVESNDAVRLFVERASERAGRRIGDHMVAVGTICRQLDGIPLAIELAATLCDSRSVPEILELLQADQRVRVQSTSDGIKHHRSWHDSISWSLGLLDEAERTALGRLAVFRGGFDRQAALDVCGGGSLARSTLDPLIDRLVSKSVLLVVEEGESGVRLAMLESVRLASQPLVPDKEQLRLVGAHRGYFAGRALEIGPRIYLETGSAVAALDADHDNIRSALALAIYGDPELGLPPDVDLAAAMVAALMPYWTTQGHSGEAERWAHEITGLINPVSAPHVAMSAGVAAAFNARYEQAFDYLDMAQRSLEQSGRKNLLAWSRFQAGRAITVGVMAGAVDAEALERGADLLDRALRRFAESGDPHGAALAGMFGGFNAYLRLDEQADRLFESALDDARRLAVVDIEAMAFAMTALPRLRDAEFRFACDRFVESAAALRRDRNWLNAQICTSLAAYAAACEGLEDARKLAGAACRLQITHGSREWDALTLATATLVLISIDEVTATRMIRTLDRHHSKWRQLVFGGFPHLSPLLEVGPGAPAPVMSPGDAQRTAAAILG